MSQPFQIRFAADHNLGDFGEGDPLQILLPRLQLSTEKMAIGEEFPRRQTDHVVGSRLVHCASSTFTCPAAGDDTRQ